MNTTDFLQHFVEVLQRHGFTFFFDEKAFEAPQQMSSNKQLVVQTLFALSRISVGIPLLLMNSDLYKQHGKEVLLADLKRLKEHCDLIGIQDSYGSCSIRVTISADELPDDTLVGRLAVIHEQAQHFQKYAADLNPIKARPWLRKLMRVPEGGHVLCGVFLIFSAHKKAREFFEGHIAKCKHDGFWKSHTHTHPYVVDLEDEIIQNCSGKELEKLGAAIFKAETGSTARDTW